MGRAVRKLRRTKHDGETERQTNTKETLVIKTAGDIVASD